MNQPEATRRTFIGGAAGGALAVALPGGPLATETAEAAERRADVVVVGAGIAGLAAAREIVKAGRSVLVLEARNRVGGRMENRSIAGGEVVDLGAEFIGPTQDRIKALIDELGIETFPTFLDGENVYFAGGMRTTYSDTGPTGTAPPDPLILADLAAVVTRLNEMSKEVPVDAPYEAEKAEEYDRQTLDTWLRDNSSGSERFLQLARAATRAIFGSEPRDISLLFTLFYIAASGNEQNPGTFERNFNTRNGAQETRIEGGAQSIAIAAARSLGSRVLLSSPVLRIEQNATIVLVHTENSVIRAQRAIVTLPPTLAGRIEYDPPLPPIRDGLTQRMPQGYLIKVQAVYDRPFWRDDGLNGTAVSDTGPCNVTFDSSPSDGRPGVLLGFVGGDEGRTFGEKPPAERRRLALESLARYFGDQALQPTQYIEANWAIQEFTRGCPVGIAPPGTLFEYGRATRAPVGRVHLAGTETATFWNGYMDGAVRSGERAAREVLAGLSSGTPTPPGGGGNQNGGGQTGGSSGGRGRRRRAAGGGTGQAAQEPIAIGGARSGGDGSGGGDSGGLPFTGLGLGGLVAAGLALLAGGLGARRRSRTPE